MQSRIVRVSVAAAIIASAHFACAQGDNLLPKYGPLPLTDGQKAADTVFIAEMDKEYHGDREKAAAFMSGRGWQYLGQGDRDDAMRRFNQAWLLDRRNGNALWGMAAIEASAGKFDESLKLFAEAEQFVGDNTNFSVDYAKAVGMAAVKLNDDSLLQNAFVRFERVYRKAPQDTRNLQNWAVTLFAKERYSEAWAKVKLAEATPDKAILDPQFLAALQSRMPRPQD